MPAFQGLREIARFVDTLGVKAERVCHRRVVGILQEGTPGAPLKAVELILPFDIPTAIVGNDEDCTGVMAGGSINIDPIEPERSVTNDSNHPPLWVGETGGDGKWNPNAEAAQSARVEIGNAGQRDAREAQDIAAVGNNDAVLIQYIANRTEQAVGMHIAVAARWFAGQPVGEFLGPLRVLLS